MTQDAEFATLMAQLEDWYADDVRAQDYSGGSGHGASEGGHRILYRNPYPGPNWREIWSDQPDPVARAAILQALEEELYGLDHGPSQSGPASGLHRGTQEWRNAVATADGSLRAVARRFGVSHSEVRRLRLQFGARR